MTLFSSIAHRERKRDLMEHTSNSQIPGCSSFSPSLPSEPPDIKNWFPSYQYESFVLDTSNNFRDCLSNESEETNREKEEILGDFRRIRNNSEVGPIDKSIYSNGSLKFKDSFGDGKVKNQILSKILDSSCTPSGLSEPPDIRNWFSSYVYESPVLGTNDDLKGLVSKESECEKDGSVVRESNKEQEGNLGAFTETANNDEVDVGEKPCSNGFVKCNNFSGDNKHESQSLREISDSLHSSSHLSEPPDIRNWFSSYKYESPVLGTSDEFGDSRSEEAECEKDAFFIEESDNEDGEKLGIFRKVRCRDEVDQKLLSNEFVQYNSSHGDNELQESISKGIDGVGGKESLFARNILCSEKVFEQSMEDETLQSEGINPFNNVEESSLNDDGSLYDQGQEFPQEADFLSFNINKSSGSDDGKSSKLLIHKRDYIEESLKAEAQTEKVSNVSAGSNVKLTQVSGATMPKSTHGSNGKENKGNEIAENGFVTTRKNKVTRANDENSLRRPQKISLECSRNKATVSSDGQKEAVEKRKALSERTNLQHSDVMAPVTGKWRCPQKSKPNLGPPLKQLRLERWVHRL